MEQAAASAAILAAGRRLGDRGLISAGEGNLSIRLDRDRLLITPSGRRKDELGDGDLVIVRIGHAEGVARSPSGLLPSSDLAIHLAVHASRPDIGAVAHAHLPASMALSIAGEIPDPTILPETALLLPRLPVVPYAEMGSTELADRIAAALTEEPEPLPGAVILERHGAVAVGSNLPTAVDRLELIEVLCRAWRDALLLRGARAALDGPVEGPSAGSTPRPGQGMPSGSGIRRGRTDPGS